MVDFNVLAMIDCRFEDGNGRLGRVLVDLPRLLDRRRDCCASLERAQHGGPDMTDRVCWFVEPMQAACAEASTVVDRTLE